MGKVKKRNASFIDDGDSSGAEAAPVKVSKKVKTSASGPAGAEKDDNGDTFWDISSKRRVTISKFSGKLMVSIREYYEDKAGDMKPGKKGISMSIEQYQMLLKIIPDINGELRKAGHEVDSPDAESAETPEPAAKPTKKKKKEKSKSKAKKAKKANIETTSDEEEEAIVDDDDDSE